MEQTIKQLTDLLNRANDAYYKHNKPIMSDAEFDATMKQLEQLEREYPQFKQPDSPTTHVGSDTTTHDGLVHHEVPMLSLANTYNAGELGMWCSKFHGQKVCVEWKIDGLSMSIVYDHGRDAIASTRGDGNEGTNVTSKLPYINGLPIYRDFPLELRIKHRVEIRGEVYMSWVQFEHYNRVHPDKPFANPRNGASGLLQADDPTRCEGFLSFMPYYMLVDNTYRLNQSDMLGYLKTKLKCRTPYIGTFEPKDIGSVIADEKQFKNDLYFPVDGLVIKLNDASKWDSLGHGSKYPNWAIAYKFEAENQGSTLRNVVWQVGSTGKLTPVAEFDPIPLAGTMVQRATLNNWDWMMQLTGGELLHIGDTMYVEKGGEIIPKVTKVDLLHEDWAVGVPSVCPECGGAIVKQGANHFCTNEECPARVKGAILHWCDKDCMDIKGIGPSVVESFVENASFHDVVGMYRWAASHHAGVWKGLDNVAVAIIQSVQQPAWRVLHALHINGIGKSMSKELIKRFGSIENLAKATYAELSAVPGLGSVNTQSIVDWFGKPSNIVMLMMLGEYLQALQEPSTEAEGTVAQTDVRNNRTTTAIEENLATKGDSNLPPHNGGGQGRGSLSILVSGNFGTPSRRRELEQLADQYGHLASSVSSGLDYLVIPNDGIDAWKQKAGSKYTKMQKWGHLDRIITENEFLELINE